MSNYYLEEYKKVKIALKGLGWKLEGRKNKEFCSQGVVYSNFFKRDKVIHLEFGECGCVLGEE